ncbi:hypothetical protein pb186bvf_011687 [Paramecium bursaria]
MDLGNINLSLMTLLYQQSVSFMQQLEKHTRQVQEVILTNLLPHGSDNEQSQSQEQSNDIKEQLNVEAQEYNLEQRQKQMKYQLSNLKKARQESIHNGSPDLIDGIYLLKDKIRTPVYIKRDKVKWASNLEKAQIIERNVKFEGRDSQIEKKTQQKALEKTLFVESEDKIQIQTSRQQRKLKTEQQEMNKTKKYNVIKSQNKTKIQQQNEADCHGIIRYQNFQSDELQESVHQNTEKETLNLEMKYFHLLDNFINIYIDFGEENLHNMNIEAFLLIYLIEIQSNNLILNQVY